LKTLSEALEWDDDNQWDDAIQNEYNSLNKNNTWILTKLLLKRHVIGCNWVFRIKYKVDGQVDKYKACLVTKKLLPSSRYWLHGNLFIDSKIKFYKNYYALVVENNYEVFVQANKNNIVCKLNKKVYGLNKVHKLGMLE